MENMYSVLLHDITEHMKHKEALADALFEYGSPELKKRAQLMENCGHLVEYGITADGEYGLKSASFCRQRLCPVCQWRRSLKIYKRLREAASALSDSVTYQLLTVSRPNCAAEKLPQEITTLYKNCDTLLKLPELRSRKELERLQARMPSGVLLPDVRKAVKGYFRAFECTYNRTTDMFHPHLHIVLAVNPSYYNSRYYITRERYVAAWNMLNMWDKDSAGYDLSLDIRRIKDIGGGLAEVCKYATKPLPICGNDAESMRAAAHHAEVADFALHGRRLIRAAGCIQEALRGDDLDEPDDDSNDFVITYAFEYERGRGFTLLS